MRAQKKKTDRSKSDQEEANWTIELARSGQSFITGLTAIGTSGSRVEIYVDNRKVGRVTTDQILTLGVSKGDTWNGEIAERVSLAVLETDILDRALRILEFAPRSSGVLRDKLVREEGNPEALVDVVIEKLVQNGVINDEVYAEHIARSSLVSKGLGRRRVESELYKKKISRDIIKQTMEELAESEEVDEEDSAYKQAKKRWDRFKDLAPQARRTRIYGWLARRGFAPDIIGKVINKLEGADREEWPVEVE